MDGGLLSLRWNDHGQTFFSMLSSVRRRGVYTDVTLACDGRFYPAHRLVLSTCSDFFDQMFEHTNCKNPVVVVANVSYKDLEALLNYMYLGEINVLQSELTTLMKAAEALRVKGLAEPTSSSPPKPSARETKRPHEDEARENKRKRIEDIAATRQAAENTDRTSSQPDPAPRLQPCSQSGSVRGGGGEGGGGEGWVRMEGRAIPSEPPASSAESGDQAAEADNTISLLDDVDNTTVPPSPEVKMEEVSVKEEPTSWYNENDSETARFPEAPTNLEYSGGEAGVAVGGYQGEGGSRGAGGGSGSGSSWNLLSAQVDPHLLQGMPGTSAMAGFQEDYSPDKKNVGGRRKKLTNEERQKLFALTRAHPDYSSEVLRNIMISECDLNVSARTIRRELIQAGLKTQRQRCSTLFPTAMLDVQDLPPETLSSLNLPPIEPNIPPIEPLPSIEPPLPPTTTSSS